MLRSESRLGSEIVEWLKVTQVEDAQLCIGASVLWISLIRNEYAHKEAIVNDVRELRNPAIDHRLPIAKECNKACLVVPFKLNYKPTPGGLNFSETSVPRHLEAQPEGWAYNRVSTV